MGSNFPSNYVQNKAKLEMLLGMKHKLFYSKILINHAGK